MTRILIFANGILPNHEKARALLKEDDFILCADGGTHHALALSIHPSLVVGDLDSLTDDGKKKIEEEGIKIIRYPRDKNETDLELAIDHALDQKPTSIVILGGLGNRLDQTIGNLALLSSSRLAAMDIRLDDGLEEAFFCRGRSVLHGMKGDLVSLQPWGKAVEGITTAGLKWPLNNETLYPDRTRGISNELLSTTATISLSSGLLLIIHRRVA